MTWRDVRVVDAENGLVTVHHLTRYDLGDPANHADLAWLLEDVARRS